MCMLTERNHTPCILRSVNVLPCGVHGSFTQFSFYHLTVRYTIPIIQNESVFIFLQSSFPTIFMKKADKHQKILAGAVKVFGNKGFFNARISDIAKVAQVADGTIYLYFNNKYDILLTIFEEEIGKLIVDIKEAIAKEQDPREMLYIFALKHLELVIKKKELAEVLQMELRQSSDPMKEYRITKFVNYVNIISEIIHLGQKSGVFRQDIQPGIVKRAFFGALDEMSRLWILNPEHNYSIQETAKAISSIFLNGISTSPADKEP